MTLEQMLKTPGIYLVITYTTLAAVEVDEELVCHQLKPNGELTRDGILDADGWNTEKIVSIAGPLQRKI